MDYSNIESVVNVFYDYAEDNTTPTTSFRENPFKSKNFKIKRFKSTGGIDVEDAFTNPKFKFAVPTGVEKVDLAFVNKYDDIDKKVMIQVVPYAKTDKRQDPQALINKHIIIKTLMSEFAIPYKDFITISPIMNIDVERNDLDKFPIVRDHINQYHAPTDSNVYSVQIEEYPNTMITLATYFQRYPIDELVIMEMLEKFIRSYILIESKYPEYRNNYLTLDSILCYIYEYVYPDAPTEYTPEIKINNFYHATMMPQHYQVLEQQGIAIPYIDSIYSDVWQFLTLLWTTQHDVIVASDYLTSLFDMIYPFEIRYGMLDVNTAYLQPSQWDSLTTSQLELLRLETILSLLTSNQSRHAGTLESQIDQHIIQEDSDPDAPRLSDLLIDDLDDDSTMTEAEYDAIDDALDNDAVLDDDLELDDTHDDADFNQSNHQSDLIISGTRPLLDDDAIIGNHPSMMKHRIKQDDDSNTTSNDGLDDDTSQSTNAKKFNKKNLMSTLKTHDINLYDDDYAFDDLESITSFNDLIRDSDILDENIDYTTKPYDTNMNNYDELVTDEDVYEGLQEYEQTKRNRSKPNTNVTSNTASQVNTSQDTNPIAAIFGDDEVAVPNLQRHEIDIAQFAPPTQSNFNTNPSITNDVPQHNMQYEIDNLGNDATGNTTNTIPSSYIDQYTKAIKQQLSQKDDMMSRFFNEYSF